MKIGIVVDWPDVKNAEYEVIKRVQYAAKSMDVEIVLFNGQGFRIELIKNGYKIVSVLRNYDDIEFCINMHFATPKMFDVYMYGALWNPPKFFFDWGYEMSSAHLLSFDDYLIYDSKPIKSHISTLIKAKNITIDDAIEFVPSVPGELYEPNLDNPKIFYSGINWERIGNEKGRHHDLFKHLDKHGVIKIFGPKNFCGHKPWDGFKGYQGSIPFDGVTAMKEINKCGVSLVISSDAHRESHAATNRLYESLCSGAVIISDDNTFVKENFGDCALFFEYSDNQVANAQKIHEIFEWIKSNRDEAMALAKKAQERFVERFKLEKVLANLIDKHKERKEYIDNIKQINKADEKVSVVISVSDSDINSAKISLESIKNQNHSNLDIIIYVDSACLNGLQDVVNKLGLAEISKFVTEKDISVKEISSASNGQILTDAIKSINDGYICFMNAGDKIFSDHFSSLLNKIISDDVNIAMSGSLINDTSKGYEERGIFNFMGYAPQREGIALKHFSASFLFSAKYIKNISFSLWYLDEYLGQFLYETGLSSNNITFTSSITSVTSSDNLKAVSDPKITIDRQLAVISDMSRKEHMLNPEVKHSGGALTVNCSSEQVRAEVRSFVREWFAAFPFLFNLAKKFRNNAMRRKMKKTGS